MTQTYSSGGVIFNQRDQILLIDEGDGFWGFPKGRIEAGENAITTALREIQEETGLTDIHLIKDLGTHRRHPVISGVEDCSEQKNISLFMFRTNQKLPSSNDEKNICK